MKSMTAATVRRLMASAAADVRRDDDPAVIRVLLRYHEALVQAAEDASMELADLGVPDAAIVPLLLRQTRAR